VDQPGLKCLLQRREKAFGNRVDLGWRWQRHHPGEIGSLAKKRSLDHQSFNAARKVNQRLLIRDFNLGAENLREDHPVREGQPGGGQKAQSPQASYEWDALHIVVQSW
jgi:hypothetical protein